MSENQKRLTVHDSTFTPFRWIEADDSNERVASSAVIATAGRPAVDAASERAHREKKKQTREMSPQTMSEPLLDENSERCVDDDEETDDARRGSGCASRSKFEKMRGASFERFDAARDGATGGCGRNASV